MKSKITKIQNDIQILLIDAEEKSDSDNEKTAEKWQAVSEALQGSIDALDEALDAVEG